MLGQAVGHPAPYRIAAAGQVPGEVSMETLDALAGAGHPARRRGPGVAAGQRVVSFGGVTGVTSGQLGRVNGGLGCSNPALRLQVADLSTELGVDQPEKGGHWGPVGKHRVIANHDRAPVVTPHHHFEVTSWWATQQ